jgi:hypothetical protein
VRTVEITVVFAAEVPDDTDVQGLTMFVGPSMVREADGTHINTPKSYETTNVEVIEQP